MYREQRCLSCNHLMIAEIYRDETRYYCPDHPHVNKHEYRINLSKEMQQELEEVSKVIRSRVFASLD